MPLYKNYRWTFKWISYNTLYGVFGSTFKNVVSVAVRLISRSLTSYSSRSTTWYPDINRCPVSGGNHFTRMSNGVSDVDVRFLTGLGGLAVRMKISKSYTYMWTIWLFYLCKQFSVFHWTRRHRIYKEGVYNVFNIPITVHIFIKYQ